MRVTPTAAAAVLILNRRLALICLIACWRASCSLSAGASGPMSADLSSMIFGISAPSFASGATSQGDRRDRGRAGPYVICQLTNGPRWVRASAHCTAPDGSCAADSVVVGHR